MDFFTAIQESFSVLLKGKNAVRLLGGLWVTVWISVVSVVLSLFFGVLFGIALCSKNKIIKFIGTVYLEFIRIMPQMVLLFLAYFGLTHATGLSISGEAASILVFTLWGTAEMGDLVRGALESIPRHQYESAAAIGLSKNQIFFFVIIPQAVKRLIPLSMNLITRMIKTTSLVVFVGVIEVIKIGQQIIEANRLTVPTASIAVYGVIFLLYFAVCFPLSFFAQRLEKKW